MSRFAPCNQLRDDTTPSHRCCDGLPEYPSDGDVARVMYAGVYQREPDGGGDRRQRSAPLRKTQRGRRDRNQMCSTAEGERAAARQSLFCACSYRPLSRIAMLNSS
jgi:hypothetical protein